MTAQEDRDLYLGQIPAHWHGKSTVSTVPPTSENARPSSRWSARPTRPAGGHEYGDVLPNWFETYVGLEQMAQLSNITLQVVPFHAGGHAAAGGPFTILRFSEPGLPDIVYLEHLTNALYLDKSRDTDEYLMVIDNLCVQAESPAGTINLLHRIL